MSLEEKGKTPVPRSSLSVVLALMTAMHSGPLVGGVSARTLPLQAEQGHFLKGKDDVTDYRSELSSFFRWWAERNSSSTKDIEAQVYMDLKERLNAQLRDHFFRALGMYLTTTIESERSALDALVNLKATKENILENNEVKNHPDFNSQRSILESILERLSDAVRQWREVER